MTVDTSHGQFPEYAGSSPDSPEGTIHTDGHTHHGASDATYIKIAFALMVLTGAEIAVSYLDLGKAQVPLLLIMMVVKFMTVILYFMHLKYDNVLFKRLFYTGVLLAMFVYIVALLTFHYFE
jgi:cytochrome c oxidase subunit IV